MQSMDFDWGEKKPPTIRPLFPDVVREKDLLTICAGIARFLRHEGFWPKTSELTEYLAADRGGVVDCFRVLVENRLIQRIARNKHLARYQLTTRGWHLLGLEPMEPWRKPTSSSLIRRAVNAASARMLKYEQEQRNRLRTIRSGDEGSDGDDAA